MRTLESMGKFKTVVVDPPWPLKNFGYQANENFPLAVSGLRADRPLSYDLMTLDDIHALPIADVLDDNARVFCWTVNKFIRETFDIFESWGVRYTYTMTWMKNDGIQTPVTPRFNSEWIIVGSKGSPKWISTKAFNVANFWPRGAHSEKPEGFYDLLRRVTPGPRLDVFGRRRIAGFHSWGDEAPEGEPEPDYYQIPMAAD